MDGLKVKINLSDIEEAYLKIRIVLGIRRNYTF